MKKKFFYKLFFNGRSFFLLILILILSMSTFTLPYLNGLTLDALLTASNFPDFLSKYFIYSLVLLTVTFITYASEKLINRTQVVLSKELREDFINALKQSDTIDRDRILSSEVQGRLNEIDSIEHLLSTSMYKLVSSLVTMIFALIYISTVSLSLLIFALAMIPLVYYTNKMSITKLQSSTSEVLTKNIIFSQDVSSFYSLIDFFNINKLITGKIRDLNLKNENLSGTKLQSKDTVTLSTTLISIVNNISSLGVILIAGYELYRRNISVGDFLALTQYFSYIVSPFILLSTINISIQPALTALSRYFDFIELMKPFGKKLKSPSIIDSRSLRKISSLNVQFPEYENMISAKFNFCLSAGEEICLNNANGSGKSTMFKLLTKQYYPVSDNSIFINNIDINSLNQEYLTSNIYYSNQVVSIFEGSLIDNIKLKLSKNDALSILHEESIVYNFYLELEKEIGNGNIHQLNLSIGQKKKIELLRIYLSNKELYLLDEVDSGLDNEGRILFDFVKRDKLRKNKLIITISHEEGGDKNE